MHNYALDLKQLKPAPLKPTPVAVVGARGYTGLELSRLLLRHPLVEYSGCFATDGEFRLSRYLLDSGSHRVPTWTLSELDEKSSHFEVVFLATPAEVSLELAPKFLESGVSVIDLSGAFRLKRGDATASYKKWYGLDHNQEESLKRAESGLQPWAKPVLRAGPKLISNPGCYATSILMALLPLLKAKLIDPKSLVIDAKSGSSGAGRKASEQLLHSEIEGECRPYKVGHHQHGPEIIEAAEEFSDIKIDPFFTTHLINVRRGIVSSIYANVNGRSDADAEAVIEQAYAESYGQYPLVRFGKFSERDNLVSLKQVVGTARTHISFKVVDGKLYLFSLIDNLLKGAASQAVENFNRLKDQPCELGLSQLEGVL